MKHKRLLFYTLYSVSVAGLIGCGPWGENTRPGNERLGTKGPDRTSSSAQQNVGSRLKIGASGTSPSGRAPVGQSSKAALLVWINEYSAFPARSLSGCANDVRKMKNLLIGKFGFDEEEILILGGAQAKRDAIIQAFRSHLIG